MAKVTGIIEVFINGTKQRSLPGAKLKVGGKSREAVVAGQSVVGHKETTVPSELECTIAHLSDTDAVAASALFGATVRFECDSGQTYLCTNMATTEPCEVSDGGMTLKMSGDAATLE